MNFFGYGLLSDRGVVETIIGRDPGPGKTAIVEGFQLVIQTLSQIPDPAKSKLESAWRTKDFRAYTLRSGSSIVSGVIWEISEEDLRKIKAWEFVGTWREALTATAKTSEGQIISVEIVKAPDNQPFDETVNGLRYETDLNRKPVVSEESREKDQELLESVRRQLQELAAQGAYGKQTFA